MKTVIYIEVEVFKELLVTQLLILKNMGERGKSFKRPISQKKLGDKLVYTLCLFIEMIKIIIKILVKNPST